MTTRVHLNIPGTRTARTARCARSPLNFITWPVSVGADIGYAKIVKAMTQVNHFPTFLKWEESLFTFGEGSISPSSALGGFYLSVCDLSCLQFEGPGEAEMYLEKHHCYSHILPCLCHSSCLALHLAKWPFMCVASRFMSAPLLWTSQSWRCFLAPAERSRRHPAIVLMRFFLGFDGVPVALPVLQRPASTEPWRAIRGSCRRPHKLSACVVGRGGRQHRDQEALWDFPTITYEYTLLTL